jgi:misacylated tRNA(Ala) deacylase
VVAALATELLYQKDSYLREFYAYIIEVSGSAVVLDKTAFHPTSGGVDKDLGFLYRDGNVYRVVDVVLEEGGVVKHVVEDPSGLHPGALVRGVIDWERRYKLMRLQPKASPFKAGMNRKAYKTCIL